MATVSTTNNLIMQIDKMVQLNHTMNVTVNMVNILAGDMKVFNGELDETEKSPEPKKMSKGFEAVKKSIDLAGKAINHMQQLWGKVSEIMAQADKRTGIDNRLALVNDGLRTQAKLEEQVMAVANRTRSSYESTGNLVAQMGQMDYFRGNNDKALGFAEAVNSAFAIAGTGPQEMESVLAQLTQGMTAGALGGDALLDMTKNAPILADVMATSLGLTKGELHAMAAEGRLTTDVIVQAFMEQSQALTDQLGNTPATFGQIMSTMGNSWSQFLNDMSQPGQPIDQLLLKLQEMAAWLGTAQGQTFFAGLAAGAGMVVDALSWVVTLAMDIYGFFSDNWVTISPILVGLAAIIGVVSASLLLNSVLTLAAAAAEKIKAVSSAAGAAATSAAATAQWGLNAALLANPITWIVLLIIGLIAAIIYLWKTNVDFRIGLMEIWNSILNFFDRIPLFFMQIGYGIADAFSYAKTSTLLTLQELVNGAIRTINKLIDMINTIPGVSIQAIEEVTFGSETALLEEEARRARADNLEQTRAAVEEKIAKRDAQLKEDAAHMRAEAAAKELEASEKNAKADASAAPQGENSQLEIGGGNLNKVGSVGSVGAEIDLSNQTMAYMMDIAERQAILRLGQFDAGLQVGFEDTSAQLNKNDAELMKAAAGLNANVYYLSFDGSVNNAVDARRGEDWDSIKRRALEESQQQIEIGLSSVEAVVVG